MGTRRPSALIHTVVDLEYVLKWMVGLSSVFALVTTFGEARRGRWGLVLVLAALLALLAGGVLLQLPGTGYVMALLWLAFAGTPMFAARRQLELLERGQLAGAASWAALAARLHPFDGLPAQARLLKARALTLNGELDAANELLTSLRGGPLGELAEIERLRLGGEWASIVRRVDAKPVGSRDLSLAPAYLQALGETGDAERMLALFGKLPRALTRQPALSSMVAAYAGRFDLVELMGGTHARVPTHPLGYLLGVAKQASGDRLAAEPLLEAVQQEPAWQRHALKRLRRPLAPVDHAELSAEARAALDELEHQVHWERAHPPRQPRRPVATWALMLILLVVFLVSAQRGGSMDVENLVEMGALMLPLERPGHWRVLTAGFLHYGATHLALNLLALWVLGRAVEQWWGRWSLIVCFLAGNVGAFWTAAMAMEATPDRVPVLLGASAGVFGLVGALLIFDVMGFFYGRIRLFNRRVLVLSFLLVAQLIFDSFTPIVSSLLHFAGAGFGGLAALPLAWWHWGRRAPRALHFGA